MYVQPLSHHSLMHTTFTGMNSLSTTFRCVQIVDVFIESDIDIHIKYTRDHGTLLHGVCSVYTLCVSYIPYVCVSV